MKATFSDALKDAILLLFFLAMAGCSTQKSNELFNQADRASILQTLQDQQMAWNEGNSGKFMEGYWKSDSMQFLGSDKINYGWQTTLDNYKKRYPDTVAMGKLRFEILQVNPISSDAAFLTGRFFSNENYRGFKRDFYPCV